MTRHFRQSLLMLVAILVATCCVAAQDAQSPAIEISARDPDGHGLLCTSQGKTILMVQGTPEQMGTAHGRLLSSGVVKIGQRILYVAGGAYSLHEGQWIFGRLDEVERRTTPFMPKRFLAECDAMSRAAGVAKRDGRYANFFPEMFHCSGFALRGKATKGGRVLHARVLDYMRDIDLQSLAAVAVFMPDKHNTWMTLGYAGFIGTVTAMNEKGLAVGEMGGGGRGDWDGMPMSFLLRDIMERASTVAEALKILWETPLTCEYYYVFSDKSGAMAGVHCTSKEITILEPGRQHPQLTFVPEDTVMISGRGREKHLSERIQAAYGEIDVATVIEIIKRPVAMRSNLHNAIFAPETLDMWFADAGKKTPACDEPYAHVNLSQLVEFYRRTMSSSR